MEATTAQVPASKQAESPPRDEKMETDAGEFLSHQVFFFVMFSQKTNRS
jgi:hypothetical protein